MGQRTAIYCRVSTADQSCDRQERDLLAFAARAGYEVVGIWAEARPARVRSRTRRALELGERPEEVEDELAGGARRVDRLLELRKPMPCCSSCSTFLGQVAERAPEAASGRQTTSVSPPRT